MFAVSSCSKVSPLLVSAGSVTLAVLPPTAATPLATQHLIATTSQVLDDSAQVVIQHITLLILPPPLLPFHPRIPCSLDLLHPLRPPEPLHPPSPLPTLTLLLTLHALTHQHNQQTQFEDTFGDLEDYIAKQQDLASDSANLYSAIKKFKRQEGLTDRQALGLDMMVDTTWTQDYAARWVAPCFQSLWVENGGTQSRTGGSKVGGRECHQVSQAQVFMFLWTIS